MGLKELKDTWGRFGVGIHEGGGQRIEGWLTDKEADYLAKSAAKFNRAGCVIVEVGSWKGRSTEAIAKAAPLARVIAVDTWEGSPTEPEHREAREPGDKVFAAFKANVLDRYPNVEALRMDSVAAAGVLEKDGIRPDMTFIDGDHTYEGCLRDIKAYLPLTKHLICGHDFTDPRFQGIRDAVAETFLSAFKLIYGTSIWRVKLEDGKPIEEEPKPDRPRIFVGSPVYKEEHPMFRSSLEACALLLEDKYDISLGTVYGDAMVERARANVLGKYLSHGPFDIFVGIDCDITFHPTSFDAIISRMLWSQAQNPGNPAKWIHSLGMPYPFKVDDPKNPKHGKPVLRAIPGERVQDGIVEVKWQGGGFFAVTDYLLKKMFRAYPELMHYNHPERIEVDNSGFVIPGQQTWHLWQSMIRPMPEWGGKPELISEDWAFMERIRECGFKNYIDIYALAAHCAGDKIFRLSTEDVIKDGDCFADPDLDEGVNEDVALSEQRRSHAAVGGR